MDTEGKMRAEIIKAGDAWKEMTDAKGTQDTERGSCRKMKKKERKKTLHAKLRVKRPPKNDTEMKSKNEVR